MCKLVTDTARMERNFEMTSGMVAAEPAYILLAAPMRPCASSPCRRRRPAAHCGS